MGRARASSQFPGLSPPFGSPWSAYVSEEILTRVSVGRRVCVISRSGTVGRDGRILQVARPSPKLSRNGFAERFEIGNLRFQFGKFRQPLQKTQHRPHLARRPARDVEEGGQFLSRPALEAFGDVVGDRQRGPLHLTVQIAFEVEPFVSGEREDAFGQREAVLPDRQLLEPLVLDARCVPDPTTTFKSAVEGTGLRSLLLGLTSGFPQSVSDFTTSSPSTTKAINAANARFPV